jgi:hypothetical protein
MRERVVVPFPDNVVEEDYGTMTGIIGEKFSALLMKT